MSRGEQTTRRKEIGLLPSRYPVRALASSRGRELLLTAIYFAIVGASIVSLVISLSVNRYYRTSDYGTAPFDFEISGPLDPTMLARIEAIAEPGSVASFVALAPAEVHAGDRRVAGAFVFLALPPARLDRAWFQDEMVVAEADVPAPWLDLSVGMARDLGVSPGDTVSVPLLDSSLQFRVRRLLATTRGGFPFAAGPITEEAGNLMSTTPEGVVPGVAVLGSAATKEEVSARIFGTDREPERYLLRSRAEALAEADADPLQDVPVLVAAVVLGVGLLLGLAVREGAALVRRRYLDIALLRALGVRRRRIIGALFLLELVAVLAGVVAAYVAIATVAFRVLFAPALPAPFIGPVVASLLVAGAVYLLVITWSVSRRLGRSGWGNLANRGIGG